MKKEAELFSTMPKMPKGSWVQTERNAHIHWDELIAKHPISARLMHRLVGLMDHRGAVVVSQQVLADLLKVHRNSINKAIRHLENHNWIETVQIGAKTGGVRGYIVNRRVAWANKRKNQIYAAFDARIIASIAEQGEGFVQKEEMLIQLPKSGEFQIPTGEIDPPAQPSIEGLEPDLPSIEGDAHLQSDWVED